MSRSSPLSSLGAALNPMPRGASNNPMNSSAAPMNPASDSGMPPLVADALRLSRAALTNDSDQNYGAKPLIMGTRARQDAIWRWDAGVRADVCRFELLSSLRFEQGSLWHVPPVSAEGRAALKIITITAPVENKWGAVVEAQAKLVAEYIDERDERMPEILVQDAGLWPFWIAVTNIAPARMRRTMELLDLALWLGSTVVLRLKHDLACPRPMDVSASIQAIIETPGHASLPSGHATAAYLVATLLERLLPPSDYAHPGPAILLKRLAFRIAENRVVAGVHFPMDSIAGCLLGETLANYFIAACTGEARPFSEASFDLTKSGIDFATLKPPEGDDASWNTLPGYGVAIEATLQPVNAILKSIWDEASKELARFGFIGPYPLPQQA